MKPAPHFTVWLLSLAMAPALLAPVWAQPASPSDKSAAQAEFERGYYLETHDGNLADAAAAYERAVADHSAPASLHAEATKRLAACRENLVAQDLARVMPSDTLAYLEIAHPGEQLTRVATMLGLVREPNINASKSGAIRLGNGIFFPEDFTISPALVAELKKVQGVAVGLTGIAKGHEPDGLLAIHPGNSDLLRGILETAIQVLEPADPIDGFKTYRGPDKKSWITVTSQLFLVAPSREQLTAAVARLHDPKADSLGSKSDFQSWAKDRQNALLFVHVDGPQVVKQLGPALKGKEAMVARGLLDVDHLQSLVATLGASDDHVQFQVQLNLTTGHRNLVYSLVRTAPLSRRSLAAVPQGALGVAMLGLNAPSDAAAGNRGPAAGGISLMDLGREIFANIEEASLFALPPSSLVSEQKPIPEFGLVLAVKDPARSEALWNQLLALPAMFGAPGVQPAGEIQIEGQTGKLYQFGKGPALVVVSTTSGNMIAGTEGAVTASLKALAAKNTIGNDPEFASLLERLTPNSSKALLVDVGRIVQLGASTKKNDEKAAVASMIFKNVKVSAVTDEAPTQLSLTLQATGLPNLPSFLKTAITQPATQNRNETHE